MITQTTPAGISLSPISGPRVNTGLQVKPADVQPLFSGQNQALNKLRTEETIYRQREIDRQALLDKQMALYDESIAASSGGDLMFDLNTEKGRLAQQKVAEKRSEFRQKAIGSITQATDPRGRLDGLAAAQEIESGRLKLEQDLLSDDTIKTAGASKLERDQFDKGVEERRKAGYFVDISAANEARQAWMDSENDLSGNTRFDRSSFDVDKYTFDSKALNTDLNLAVASAVGETNLLKIVSADKLNAGFIEQDGVLTLTENVQNSLDKATEMGLQYLEDNPRLQEFLKAQGHDPKTYMTNRIKSLLREEQNRIITTNVEGLASVNSSARQRIKSEADQKRKETPNFFGIDTSTDKGRELNALAENLATRGYNIIPERTQLQEVEEERKRLNKERAENGLPPLTTSHIQIEDGRIVIRDHGADGNPGEVIQDFGKIVGGTNVREKEFRAANQSYDLGNIQFDPNVNVADFNTGNLGFDYGVVMGFETGTANRSGQGNAQRMLQAGDGGTSFGTFQMHKGLFSSMETGFLGFLDKKGILPDLSQEQLNALNAGNAKNKDNILGFYKGLIDTYGEETVLGLEVEFMSNGQWKEALDEMGKLFGDDLHPAIRTYVVDTANQSSPKGSKQAVRNAAAWLRNKGIDPLKATPKQMVEALARGRAQYFRGLPENIDGNGITIWNGEIAEREINKRVIPLAERMVSWVNGAPDARERTGAFQSIADEYEPLNPDNLTFVETPVEPDDSRVDLGTATPENPTPAFGGLAKNDTELADAFTEFVLGSESFEKAAEGRMAEALASSQKYKDATTPSQKKAARKGLNGVMSSLLSDPEIRNEYLRKTLPIETQQQGELFYIIHKAEATVTDDTDLELRINRRDLDNSRGFADPDLSDGGLRIIKDGDKYFAEYYNSYEDLTNERPLGGIRVYEGTTLDGVIATVMKNHKDVIEPSEGGLEVAAAKMIKENMGKTPQKGEQGRTQQTPPTTQVDDDVLARANSLFE